jgi:phosphoribosylformylglycinamidine synthase
LKKSILQAAIQGQLVAQDPNDEPASELIKRIQAEKERLISEKKIKKPKVKSEIAVRDGLPYEIINGIERCIADELPFEIPESWCWVRLNDYLDVRDGTHDTPKYVVSGIPLVTSKNLNNGKLDFSNIKYISEEDHKQISLRSGVDVGDILFAMIGSIGNPVLIKENSNFSIKNIGLFKKYISDTSMEYVYYMLLKLQDDMRKKASGGVQSFVSLSFLRDYLIPIPPLNEQKRIVQKIEELFSHIEFL